MPSAVNTTLLAFAVKVLSAVLLHERVCSFYAAPAAGTQCPQARSCRARSLARRALSSKPTGHCCCCLSGQTDVRLLRRRCCAYYAGSVSNLNKKLA